ncbi:integrin alpha-9-like [Uloborus diversus]|uniref:integrin alpha-9-like n=1 Tax=Uloborus diversus TaxID=327109 RepID=UPI002409D8B6|nr:integrin alpha-9-like [Uloborus diversus]
MTPGDNSLTIPILFKAVSDVSIEGNPNPEQVAYDGKRKEEKSISLSHTYYVWNQGPSPFNVADIKLYVPSSFRGKDGFVNFLSGFSVKADFGRSVTVPAYCNITYLQSKLASRNTSTANDVPKSYDSKESTTETYNPAKSMNMGDDTVSSHLDKKTAVTKRKDIVVNCKTSVCEEIHCYASPFLDAKKVARITASFVIDGSIFDTFLDEWSLVKYVTEGHVSIRGEKDIQPIQNHPDKKEISTIIVHSGPPPPEEIDQWIIFVSIGVGVLLLLLILVLLIRFGFFKRKQKEKLKLMVAGTEGEDNESFGEAERNDEALE